MGEKSESVDRVKAIIAMAAPMLPMEVSEFDRDPWLLNVANGTVDLRTGELRPHDRNDYIMKLAPVVYDPTASAPTWDASMATWQPDDAVRGFLQRLMGYGLTGVVRDHVFPIHYGTGRNGKGTFLHAIRRTMGDYATMVPTSMLEEKRHDAHPAEKVTLLGRRYALATETKQQCVLDVAWVKLATGGDAISARGMRENFFDFEPSHHLHLMTNHRPVIKETKDAIWDRVVLIPWQANFIKGANLDTALDVKLKAEASGILRWLVEGCLNWQRNGLQAPAVVQVATRVTAKQRTYLGSS